MRKLVLPLLTTLLTFTTIAVSARGHHHRAPVSDAVSGRFDYYLMSLSWSPTFCETHPDEQDQCAHRGYGFVLHGLWPQYERGGGPQHCAMQSEPDRKTVADALAFMPSTALIRHEWQTHGSCSGLDPAGYFGLADRAFAAVHVPPELNAPQNVPQMSADDVSAAFLKANPGMDEDALTLHCSRGELAEVRVCLDKDLHPRACGGRVRSSCPSAGTLRIPLSR